MSANRWPPGGGLSGTPGGRFADLRPVLPGLLAQTERAPSGNPRWRVRSRDEVDDAKSPLAGSGSAWGSLLASPIRVAAPGAPIGCATAIMTTDNTIAWTICRLADEDVCTLPLSRLAFHSRSELVPFSAADRGLSGAGRRPRGRNWEVHGPRIGGATLPTILGAPRLQYWRRRRSRNVWSVLEMLRTGRRRCIRVVLRRLQTRMFVDRRLRRRAGADVGLVRADGR